MAQLNKGTYYQNEVFEPVEVIVHYNKLEVNILRFKWKDRAYKVTKMAEKWTFPTKDSIETHYTVYCDESSMIAELSFDHKDLKWELIQYDTFN